MQDLHDENRWLKQLFANFRLKNYVLKMRDLKIFKTNDKALTWRLYWRDVVFGQTCLFLPVRYLPRWTGDTWADLTCGAFLVIFIGSESWMKHWKLQNSDWLNTITISLMNSWIIESDLRWIYPKSEKCRVLWFSLAPILRRNSVESVQD